MERQKEDMEEMSRDTQFRGSAKRLIEDLKAIHALRMDITDEVDEVIARHDYDLACHTVKHLSDDAAWLKCKGYTANQLVEMDIPDMTELPKEQDEKASEYTSIESKIAGMRIILKGRLSVYHEVQAALYNLHAQMPELYLQRYLDPEYLFLSEENHKEISKYILDNSNICRCTPDEATKMRSKLQPFFVNQTTGALMYMMTLPELESGTIIVGFFGG
jgi:hypothetical protein